MNLVDANVLISSVNEDDPRHQRSRLWLEAAPVAGVTVGFAWITLLAFVRLVTRIDLFPHPLRVEEATERVRALLGHPAVVIAEPTPRHLDVLSGFLAAIGTGGNLVNDAHLAALALEHNATVITYDSDFGRFSGVRWSEPTQS